MHTLLHPLHGIASSSSSRNGVPGGESISSYILGCLRFSSRHTDAQHLAGSFESISLDVTNVNISSFLPVFAVDLIATSTLKMKT